MLPASMGNDLTNQGASRNGAMMFELRSQDGRITHAGVLDFTAPEGTVQIPAKVRWCVCHVLSSHAVHV